ncbi:unnamed protein product [Hydatigera taeniaeformis]|uniref:NPC1_N domain-containing protein n=1 Tax=Hydatigena taeniaeformis TaxID=6205 RepID=A0A0R3WZV7_HYDTA|nr:unnamed protein product [Hydatigera taeniaeformis]
MGGMWQVLPRLLPGSCCPAFLDLWCLDVATPTRYVDSCFDKTTAEKLSKKCCEKSCSPPDVNPLCSVLHGSVEFELNNVMEVGYAYSTVNSTLWYSSGQIELP